MLFRSLLGFIAKARKTGAKVHFSAASPEIERTIRQHGVKDVDFFPTIEAARARISRG